MKLQPLGKNVTELAFIDGTRILFSYQTPVAAYVPGKGYMRTDRHYSVTTSRHVNAWLGDVHASRVPQNELDALGKIGA